MKIDKNFEKYYTIFVGIPLVIYLGYHTKTLFNNTCNTKKHSDCTTNNK